VSEAKDTKGKKPCLIDWRVYPMTRGYDSWECFLICFCKTLNSINYKGSYVIEEVRDYGTKKYGDPENWKEVPPQEYCDAFHRHIKEFDLDPKKVDKESGLKHASHALCNAYFLTMFEKEFV